MDKATKKALRRDKAHASAAAQQLLKKGPAGSMDRARRHLIAGLLVLVPLVVAGWAVLFITDAAETFFGPAVVRIFQLGDFRETIFIKALVRFLSFILALVVIMAVGYLSTFFFIRRIILLGESIVTRVPFIKFFYATPKEVLNTLTMPKNDSRKRVVMVEYPRKGIWAFAFATGEIIRNPDGLRLIAVFLPTTPNPTSGFLLYLPEHEILDTNVSVEDGARLIISGGILSPADVHTQKFTGLDSPPDLPPLGPVGRDVIAPLVPPAADNPQSRPTNSFD